MSREVQLLRDPPYFGIWILPPFSLIGLNDSSGTAFPLGSVTCNPKESPVADSATVAWNE